MAHTVIINHIFPPELGRLVAEYLQVRILRELWDKSRWLLTPSRERGKGKYKSYTGKLTSGSQDSSLPYYKALGYDFAPLICEHENAGDDEKVWTIKEQICDLLSKLEKEPLVVGDVRSFYIRAYDCSAINEKEARLIKSREHLNTYSTKVNFGEHVTINDVQGAIRNIFSYRHGHTRIRTEKMEIRPKGVVVITVSYS